MKEVWEDVAWYKWLYQISNLGNIKSLSKKIWNGKIYYKSKEKILQPSLINSWYLVVNLRKNNVTKIKLIHRMVATAFIKNPNNKLTVNHKDGNKINNNFKNLERNTYSENHKHSFKKLWRQVYWKNKYWKDSYKSKLIWQYNLKNNKLINKRYGSWEIKRYLWYNSSNITSCCRWELKQAYGFIWKYIA